MAWVKLVFAVSFNSHSLAKRAGFAMLILAELRGESSAQDMQTVNWHQPGSLSFHV